MIFSVFRIVLIFLLVFFQYSFLNFVFPDWSTPNFVLMWVVAYVVVLGWKDSWKWVILLGALVDLVSFSFFGKNILIFIAIACLSDKILRLLVIERQGGLRMFMFFILAFFASFFYNTLEIIWPENRLHFSNLLGIVHNFGFFFKTIIFQSVLNTIFLYISFIFIRRLEKDAKFFSKARIKY